MERSLFIDNSLAVIDNSLAVINVLIKLHIPEVHNLLGTRFFHRWGDGGFTCSLDPMCVQMELHLLGWPGSWQSMAGAGPWPGG